MLDDRDSATGIVRDEDRPFDLDLLVLDDLHQSVEVSRGLVEVLIDGDEDVGLGVCHLAAPLRLSSRRLVLDQQAKVAQLALRPAVELAAEQRPALLIDDDAVGFLGRLALLPSFLRNDGRRASSASRPFANQ